MESDFIHQYQHVLNYQERGGEVQSSGKGTVDQIVHSETIDQNLNAKKLQLKALQYATLAKRIVNWLIEGRDWWPMSSSCFRVFFACIV